MFGSLYIHVPFCRAKCDYCAFYSEAGSSQESRRPFMARLMEELEAGSKECAPLNSIFVGGGTPSLLSVDEWRQLFDAIHGCFALAPGCEWSIEANPDSLTPELVGCWAENGVNRISMGIQAFQPRLRDIIGRRGSLDNLPAIVESIRQNGIRRLNLDLIFNIPGQTLPEWRETLQQALAYAPTHLSAYALTLEEGTRLAKRLPPVDDELFLDFWHETDAVLSTAGIHRYEISNFSLPGEKCRHNDAIWHGATYLRCGPAASSFDGRTRWTNPPSIRQWLARTPPEKDILPPEERAAEILALGFRTLAGWRWEEFASLTGYEPLAIRGKQLRKLHAQGLIAMDEKGAAPTAQGLLFNDNLAMELL